jgi:hypothetical protein
MLRIAAWDLSGQGEQCLSHVIGDCNVFFTVRRSVHADGADVLQGRERRCHRVQCSLKGTLSLAHPCSIHPLSQHSPSCPRSVFFLLLLIGRSGIVQ